MPWFPFDTEFIFLNTTQLLSNGLIQNSKDICSKTDSRIIQMLSILKNLFLRIMLIFSYKARDS